MPTISIMSTPWTGKKLFLGWPQATLIISISAIIQSRGSNSKELSLPTLKKRKEKKAGGGAGRGVKKKVNLQPFLYMYFILHLITQLQDLLPLMTALPSFEGRFKWVIP